MNVLYDEEDNEDPVDNVGQLYVPLGFEHSVAEEGQEETEKNTKN